MIQLSDIQSADWSPQLGEPGVVVEDLDDIDQCIRIVIGTPKGSVPLRPLFGCDAWLWQDAPVDVALPNVVREVYAAIAMWEPRAEIVGVTLSPGDDEAHWKIRITWQPASGDSQQITEVSNGQT
nr:GPW/gp25 family protein [uncultured Pseudogulbenkiania sp.]